jgi:hypothetical protein
MKSISELPVDLFVFTREFLFSNNFRKDPFAENFNECPHLAVSASRIATQLEKFSLRYKQFRMEVFAESFNGLGVKSCRVTEVFH